MCRPPCCNKNGAQGAGIAAVAILMLAALIVAKIGPIVADVIHTALEVLQLTALTIGVAAAVTALTWVVIKIARWQLHRHVAVAASQPRVSAMPGGQQAASSAQHACLACGGTGTVLRAISAGRWQPRQCPVCAPVARAG
jgi:hypothetical protein